MRLYAAKLLFAWDPDPITNSRKTRLCEERIVTFEARSPRAAVKRATLIVCPTRSGPSCHHPYIGPRSRTASTPNHTAASC
jgi:hypothetical protein